MAGARRGSTTAYLAGALLAALAAAAPAAAQTTGGTSPDNATSAPRLSAPPPGVVVRPVPLLRSWRCVQACSDRLTARTGSLLRVRGHALRRTFEVVFLGAAGAEDDVATAPLRRKRNVVDVRVPLGAAPGPIVVARHDGQQSLPSESAVAIVEAPSPLTAGGTPEVEVQAQARRAFFDAERPAVASFVLHSDAPAQVVVELVHSREAAVVESWDVGVVPPETPQRLSWDGTVDGRLQRQGRYSFRVTAVSADGLRAVSAQAPEATTHDPAEIQFLKHAFPVRGPHYFGELAARFGGDRGHQGQDVFAACGTPLVAARGGVVKFEQYHSRAGHYIVVDGERTGVDYAYMHLRDAALVDAGDRVHTGQLIGYVGQTGRASGCHLHFEMWRAPGWYDGGSAFDPLPSLLAWDRTS